MTVIKVEDVAHVRFAAPDLARMKAFLEDFGLRYVHTGDSDRLVMRGAGTAPYCHVTERGPSSFQGMALRARSLDDLEALAAHEGARVESSDLPGGGAMVRLQDPDGFMIDVVAGQEPREPEPLTPRSHWNTSTDRPRTNALKRFDGGPATVIRLGHVVLSVSDVSRTVDWWAERFGLLVSDDVRLPDGISVASFLRCDRGDIPTDHHSLNFATLPSGRVGFHHAAFEVIDFDDLIVGGEHLVEKSHERVWGVGRHVLGSQVFDYWADPWGNKVEHWTDGDVLTAQERPQIQGMDVMTGVQWGPALPASFL
jgi:catechol 2,3-dioxygenase-like lactoylglutathione lyase family enzyme